MLLGFDPSDSTLFLYSYRRRCLAQENRRRETIAEKRKNAWMIESMMLMTENACGMPMNDVYDVLIHFVRREDCRMKESGRIAFYNLYTRADGVDDGGGTRDVRGEGKRPYETIAGRGDDTFRLCRACL